MKNIRRRQAIGKRFVIQTNSVQDHVFGQGPFEIEATSTKRQQGGCEARPAHLESRLVLAVAADLQTDDPFTGGQCGRSEFTERVADLRLFDLAQAQRPGASLESRDVAICEARLAVGDSNGRETTAPFVAA